MLREIRIVSAIFIMSLLIVNTSLAKSKIDSTVQYTKTNKPYCNTGLQLFYSPPKDQYFCSRIRVPLTDGFVYIKKDGKPACKSPKSLAYIGETSKHFYKKPTCITLN